MQRAKRWAGRANALEARGSPEEGLVILDCDLQQAA